MAQVTLLSIKTAAREEADMVNSQMVKDTELTRYVNRAGFMLYDELVEAYEANYNLSQATLPVTPGSTTVDLPADFYKIKAIFDSSDKRLLRPFNFSEMYIEAGPPRYMLDGTKLLLAPVPNGVLNLILWYVPVFTRLVADGDLVEGVNGFEDLMILETVERMKRKEDSDNQALLIDRNLVYERVRKMRFNRDSTSAPRVRYTDYSYNSPFFPNGVW